MLNGIAIAAITIFCYMVVFYLVAQVIHNNSIVDIGWGPGFIAVCIILTVKYPNLNDSSVLLFVLTTLWAFRLAGHILLRNAGKPEDFRYKQWRKEWGRKAPLVAFFKVFMLQGLVMLIVSLPLIVSFTGQDQGLKIYNFLGILLFSGGFLFETIADWQLSAFKKDEQNKGKIITGGLWKYSRHPNYFGEVLVWWGLWLISAGHEYWYIGLLSPLLITFLLRFVSGVPMLEKKLRKREDFREYARKTPVLIPLIGKKGF